MITKMSFVLLSGYVDHVHRPENKVHIVHGHEVEYPTGEFYPDYAIPRKHTLPSDVIIHQGALAALLYVSTSPTT